jgi:hypothetical protein
MIDFTFRQTRAGLVNLFVGLFVGCSAMVES